MKIDTNEVVDMEEKGYKFLATFVVVSDGSIGLRWNQEGLELLAENEVMIEQVERTMFDLIKRSLTETAEETEATH